MIVTTSQNIEGRKITKYLGIVSTAQYIVLAGAGKMLRNGMRRGMEDIVKDLSEQAQGLGADAVIAVSMQQIGSNMCAIGTAVKFEV